MKARNIVALSLVFIVVGFMGAAVKYWRWWPSRTDWYREVSSIVCPMCPEIDGIGTDREKFVSRTVEVGPWNAIPALIIGWTVVVVIRGKQQRHRKEMSPSGQLALMPDYRN